MKICFLCLVLKYIRRFTTFSLHFIEKLYVKFIFHTWVQFHIYIYEDCCIFKVITTNLLKDKFNLWMKTIFKRTILSFIFWSINSVLLYLQHKYFRLLAIYRKLYYIPDFYLIFANLNIKSHILLLILNQLFHIWNCSILIWRLQSVAASGKCLF